MTYLLLSGQIKLDYMTIACMYEKQLLIIITVHIMLSSFISISNAFIINLYSTVRLINLKLSYNNKIR